MPTRCASATADDTGYRVIRGALKISARDLDLARQVVDEHGCVIFNDALCDSEDNDQMRMQCGTMGRLRGLVGRMRRLVSKEAPTLTMSSPVIIKSLRGCRSQMVHCDYDPESLTDLRDDMVPHGMLVALEEGTSLLVYPGSHRLKEVEQPEGAVSVHLSAGDAVVFRGDLLHAGSSYSSENTRMHVYLDAPGVPRSLNVTHLAGF